MIKRAISDTILDVATKFPVVTLTGPRQSGKSTLLKSCFADYKYISLEDPDVRQLAENDPRGFLRECGTKCIIEPKRNAFRTCSLIYRQSWILMTNAGNLFYPVRTTFC